jgi:dolichol kinase
MSDVEYLLELKRKMFHLIMGLCISVAIYFLKPVYGLWIIAPVIIALFGLLLAPKVAHNVKLVNQLLFHFERRKDIETFPFKGAIHYGLGILFPIVITTETSVACAIIATLSVGDAASTLIGKFFGKIRIGKKSLEGTVSFVIFGFLGAYAFLREPVSAFVLAFVGAIIELFSKYDDNLTIPLGLSVFHRLIF